MDDPYLKPGPPRHFRPTTEEPMYTNDSVHQVPGPQTPEQRGPIKAYVDFTDFNRKYEEFKNKVELELNDVVISDHGSNNKSENDADTSGSSQRSGGWVILGTPPKKQ